MTWPAMHSTVTPTGSRAFMLKFGNIHSYRAEPILPGVLTREELRTGMTAQYPR